jgi:hypothetical protein
MRVLLTGCRIGEICGRRGEVISVLSGASATGDIHPKDLFKNSQVHFYAIDMRRKT